MFFTFPEHLWLAFAKHKSEDIAFGVSAAWYILNKLLRQKMVKSVFNRSLKSVHHPSVCRTYMRI